MEEGNRVHGTYFDLINPRCFFERTPFPIASPLDKKRAFVYNFSTEIAQIVQGFVIWL